MNFSLYIYTHRKSGKSYIGATMDLERRHKEHAHGRSKARAFNSAVKKYGIAAFDFRVLAILDNSVEAARIEQAGIKAFGTLAPNGYNLNGGAPYTRYAGPNSEETRAKISTSQKASPKYQKHLAEMSAANRGHLVSLEARQRRSVAWHANPKCQEVWAKLKASQMDVPLSPETRQKISDVMRASPKARKQRAELSAARKGKPGKPWSVARRAAEINRKIRQGTIK